MAFILVLEDRKMPEKIKEIFNLAKNEKVEIYIPAIVFAELAYLSEKNRINTNLKEAEIFLDNHKKIIQYPLTISVVKQAFKINDIPELHDRLISAVGRELQIPILTNDPIIQSSKHVEFLW